MWIIIFASSRFRFPTLATSPTQNPHLRHTSGSFSSFSSLVLKTLFITPWIPQSLWTYSDSYLTSHIQMSSFFSMQGALACLDWRIGKATFHDPNSFAFSGANSQLSVMGVTLAGAAVASCLRYGSAVLKAVTPSPRVTYIERRPRNVAAAPSFYDLKVYPTPVLLPRPVYPPPVLSDSPIVYQPRRPVPTAKVAAEPSYDDLKVYPAPVLLPRLVYPPPVLSDSPIVYQPRRPVPTAKVYPPPFIFLPPPIRRAWIFYLSRFTSNPFQKNKKTKKKLNTQIATKNFPRKEDFFFVVLRDDFIPKKDQQSTTDFHSTDVADIRFFLQV